jgi:hypothetical protein
MMAVSQDEERGGCTVNLKMRYKISRGKYKAPRRSTVNQQNKKGENAAPRRSIF